MSSAMVSMVYGNNATSFHDQPGDLKSGALSLDNEIELVGKVIFQRVQNQTMGLIVVHLFDQE